MTKFHSVSDDSYSTPHCPWGQRILSGLNLVKVCYACAKEGRRIERPQGVVEIVLERGKGSYWPDVLGCGAWPLFIVSRRVLDDWKHSGTLDIPAYPVRIVEPLPKKLHNLSMPEYFWLDGTDMLEARLDFEASGFVNVSFCPECGTRMNDISATYERQHSGTWPMAILENTWNGADMFTTDLSPAAFFCTGKVLECAKRNKHTNFRFVPAEVAASPADGIKYL